MTNNNTAITLISSASKLAALGKSLAKQINDYEKDSHVYLASEIAHIETYRNPTRLSEYFRSIQDNKIAHFDAQLEYVLAFGNVKIEQERNDKGELVQKVPFTLKVKKTRSEAIAAFNVKRAMNTHWRKFAELQELPDYTIDKAEDDVTKTLAKMMSVGYTADTMIDLIKKVEAQAAQDSVKVVERKEKRSEKVKAAKAAKNAELKEIRKVLAA